VADRFHGAGSGERAEAHFDRLFKDRAAPDEVPEIEIDPGTVHMPALLVDGLGVGSRSEARRMLTQGGVSVDGVPLLDLDVDASALDGRVVRAGKKRFAKARVRGG
jgi:tyrosyl-tRNA synthetase